MRHRIRPVAPRGRRGAGRAQRHVGERHMMHYFKDDEALTSVPIYALLDVVRIPPGQRVSPWDLIARRVALAFAILLFVAAVAYLGQEGYSEDLTVIDALYYAAVSLSTTGYGDIAPVDQTARLVNLIVVTPLRVAFLIILVSTTLSVLTEESRRTWQINRWRKRVRNHTIIIGYGTKGRAAIRALIADGTSPNQIVVIDNDTAALARAEHRGLVTVHGSATKSDVLKIAGAQRARAIVVAPNLDDTAVLVTLCCREIAPEAFIVASVRESENRHLLEQSGADSVVVSSETAGRMLGLATVSPTVVEMMEDLLSPDDGISIAERPVAPEEIGRTARALEDVVLGVVRAGQLYRLDVSAETVLTEGDQLLYIKQVDKPVELDEEDE